jgi:S1-C subfamily serine protease
VVGLGVQLLGAGISVPGGEGFSQRFRVLSQEQELARQAGKGKDVTRLKGELHALYTEFGRKALASKVPFEGRAEREAHWQLSQTALSKTQSEIDTRQRQWTTAPRQTKRQVLVGLVAAAAMVALVAAGVVWRLRTARPAGEPPAPILAATSDKQPSPRPLQELFVQLAPAVPLVEAVGAGTGSGFLLKQDGKYFVITNRHVIEYARQGVAVHFLLADDKRFTVPAAKTSIQGIHRSADLALVDVSAATEEIDQLRIEPVALAPAGNEPKVGQHVFAIGHPGSPQGEVLSRTLTDGIVSAVGRQEQGASFLQVTVPLNPGNSGGPLFDDHGRVIGVNTFGLRRGSRPDVPLEALNFALEGKFVHELMTDPTKSFGRKEVEEMQARNQAPPPQVVAGKIDAVIRRYTAAGYRPYAASPRESTRIVRLPGQNQQQFVITCERGVVYAVVAISLGGDMNLAVADSAGRIIASDQRENPDAEVVFRPGATGYYSVVVMNSSPNEGQGVVIFLVQ